MSFVLKTVEAIGIFLGLGFIGFFLLAKKGIAKEALATLSFLSLDLAIPAMVFHDVMVLFSPTKYPKWWIYPLVWLLSFIFLYFLSLLFSFLFSKSYRKEAFVSLLYPNAIFIPLILLPSLFPERPEITVDLFLFTMLYPFFLFQVFPFFYGSKKGFSLRRKRMFPTIVVVLLVSIFIHYLGLRPFVPRFLINIARRVGVISVPLLLFVIGGDIYLDRSQNSHIPVKDKILFVFIKNLAFPVITLFYFENNTPSFPFKVSHLFSECLTTRYRLTCFCGEGRRKPSGSSSIFCMERFCPNNYSASCPVCL